MNNMSVENNINEERFLVRIKEELFISRIKENDMKTETPKNEELFISRIQAHNLNSFCLFQEALKKGDLETMKSLMKNGFYLAKTEQMDFSEICAEEGSLAALELIHENDWPLSYCALSPAETNGDTEMVEWLNVNLPISVAKKLF